MFFRIRTTSRRLLMTLAALGLVAAGLWAAAPAGAQQLPPPPPPTPVADSVTFVGICPFAVQIDIQGKAATLTLPNGTIIATSPTQTATVTNLVTGKQVNLKIPGPIQTLPSGETVFVGPSLVIRSTQFGDDTNALVYVAGRYTFLPGRVPPFSGVGKLVDVCAALS